ncbi:MAG: hypothetical protein NC548_12775 [Lachnospiraceae bacterium]|nr:hypothetical protein [Lachnospiraceae bacterium]MCM1230736.1 hypothetical protein [Ruminococcus flavefaciens]
MFKKNIDKKFEHLGFKKVYQSPFIVQYERKDSEFGYIQCLDLCHKRNGRHLIISYQKDINKNGFNNTVGISQEEADLALKKMHQLKWR